MLHGRGGACPARNLTPTQTQRATPPQKKTAKKVFGARKARIASFENLIADIFAKIGRKLYYFHKDSGLEVDFVIRYKGECTLVEVKAATGNIKSTKTILNHPEKYHVSSAIKLGDYNVGRTGQVLTLPLYMAFLLRTL